MPGLVSITAGTLATVFGVGGILLRRKVARNWIDYRHQGPTDLNGKVIVITGANTGLGLCSAKEFAKRNGTVVMACRDTAKAQAAADEIIQSNKNAAASVDFMELDLSSLDSVDKFSDELMRKYPKIYALICNAGVWMPMDKECKTVDGYEAHFGINHLGHFALAKKLTDHMAKSKEECRIVWVSSGLLKSGKIDMNTQDFVYKGRKADDDTTTTNDDKEEKKKRKGFAPTGYTDSKLMNALTNRHLATILGKTAPHVTSYAVCPGFCRTSLGRHVSFPFYKKLVLAPIMLMIQRTSVQGAQNIIHASLEDRDKLKPGGLYRDGGIAKEETELLDSLDKDDVAKNLWDLSEKLLNKK